MLNTSVVLRIVLTVVFVAFVSVLMRKSLEGAGDVRAFGNLSVRYEDQPLGGPLFVASRMLPGECVSREVVVKNNGQVSSRVYVKAVSLMDQLSDAVDLKILREEEILRDYSLSSFFGESATSSGVLLDLFAPQETQRVSLEVCITKEAADEYENKLVKFDLHFEEVLDRFVLPLECERLKDKITRKIEGTARNDRIRGRSESEYIVGLGGKDRIDGGGGDDCIEGGEGDDHIDGRGGGDVLMGGSGKDWVGGSDGNDLVLGNDGDDKLDGGWDDDVIQGGAGRDQINGDRGRDTCTTGERYRNCEVF